MGMMGLVRLAATGVGLAARLAIARLRRRACRNQAIVAFRAELKAASLPPHVIAELSDLYPSIDLPSVHRLRPPRA